MHVCVFVEWYEIAIVLTTISLFIASMYQARLIKSENKLSAKPVFSFSLNFSNNRKNLLCTNIGNGLAKDIEFVIKVKEEIDLKPEIKIYINGLAKGDTYLINNWQNYSSSGVGAYDFNCGIIGSCKDIFNDSHKIDEKLHFNTEIE